MQEQNGQLLTDIHADDSNKQSNANDSSTKKTDKKKSKIKRIRYDKKFDLSLGQQQIHDENILKLNLSKIVVQLRKNSKSMTFKILIVKP